MDDAEAKVWEMIAGHRTAMLTTLHEGALVSRPMATKADRDGHRIYLITSFDAKTRDIAADAAVNLSYVDGAANNYLSLSGTASVSQDRAKLRELWSPWAQAWLPGGPDDPDAALITIVPGEATLWDGDASRIVATVKMLTAALTGRPPSVGKVEHVAL